MQRSTPTDEKASAHNPRPRYVYIGEDADGGTHVYRTADETIFALTAAGRIEYRFDIAARPESVDDYVSHVTAERGWYDLVYGYDAFADQFAEVLA